MEEIKFSEKQYLGLNKMSFFRRISLSVFCFIAYYLSENHDKSGELFFFLGISILVISALLVFILHFETKIINNDYIPWYNSFLFESHQLDSIPIVLLL